MFSVQVVLFVSIIFSTLGHTLAYPTYFIPAALHRTVLFKVVNGLPFAPLLALQP